MQAIEGILMWRLNILDELTNEPNKAGEEYMRLVNEEWRSSQLVAPTYPGEDMATFAFRGFKGQYRLALLVGGVEGGQGEGLVEEDTNIHCYLTNTETLGWYLSC